jgi:hypothetical protein
MTSVESDSVKKDTMVLEPAPGGSRAVASQAMKDVADWLGFKYEPEASASAAERYLRALSQEREAIFNRAASLNKVEKEVPNADE